jgi:hypothetical protein
VDTTNIYGFDFVHNKIQEARCFDAIQERVEQENLDSSVIVPTVQFYAIMHNPQFDRCMIA